MAQNRRIDVENQQWGTYLRAVVAIVLISGLGILYVRQTRAHDDLGRKISQLEKNREDLILILSRQRATLAQLSSDSKLRERAEEWKLGLVPTRPSQRLTVMVPSMPIQPSAPVSNPTAPMPPGRNPASAMANLPGGPVVR